MKNFNKFYGFLLMVAVCVFVSSASLTDDTPPVRESHGGGEFVFQNTECISDADRPMMWEEINKNIDMLTRQGKIHYDPDAVVLFEWPLKKAANLTDPGYYGISNYVDQNNTSALLDYNCGQRTYNGHKGTDIYTWPFGWYKMDNNQVEIIAAAPGVITYRNDGQFDRSCAMNGNQWNAVYVRHIDGSIAWYGHLKKNSVTSKGVGDSVALGEYLGVLGSSGNSTGPHLHFEVYNNSSQLIDPWQGTCNSLNPQSWWGPQKPYFEPKINALKTNARPPVFPTCPTQEILNTQSNFNPGDSIFFIPYYADQAAGLVTQFTLFYPNNTVWDSWSHSSPQYYGSSYWWWWNIIPANAPFGTYKFRAVFNGVTYETNFDVGLTGIQNITSDIPERYSLSQNYPNPFNPETKIKFDVPSGVNSNVKLSIFNVAGQEVEVLVNETLAPGTYQYTFSGSNLASGMYFYKLQTGDFVETKRMVLVK